jgi:hypothetical protein
MVTSTAGKPSVGTVARFAYAAGFTGILANLFLIAMYVGLGLQAGGPEAQTTSLGPAGELSGSASDLVGSLSVACMIPVALALGGRLPRRRAVRLTQAAGLTAMALLAIGGPLLVLGVLAFEVETPIAMAAWVVLCLWLLLVNRWLRLSDALPVRVARLGEALGTGVLWSLGWLSCCRGCRGHSWGCSASASSSGCPPTSASRSGSCSWDGTWHHEHTVFFLVPVLVSLGKRSPGRVMLWQKKQG